MITKAIALLVLLLAPAGVAHLAGYVVPAHYFALGAVLAIQLTLLARPVAGFSFLLPCVYAAAAITAQATGGVAALLVAAAAVVGAASSQGLQRGLLAVLAATLVGSSEPATASQVVLPTLSMLAGSTYGFALSMTLLRSVTIDSRAVHPQTALSYAVLLAVLVVVAWFAARALAVPHGWWVPLAVAAVGQPALDRTVRRSIAWLAATLLGTLALVTLIELTNLPLLRAVLLLVMSLVFFTFGMSRRWMRALLFTPIVLVVVTHVGDDRAIVDSIEPAFMACAMVFGVAVLGQWLLWTIRPDPGHVPA